MARIVWNPGPLLGEVKTKAAQKMYQTVTVLVNEARRIVPVRTGYLKSSLTCEVTADGRTGFYGSFRPWAGEKSVEYACVAPPFPVLTAEGTKDVSELSAEDALCTPFGFRKPALAFSKPWKGELVRIELKGFPFPLRLTPDHVLPVVPSFPCPFERSYVYLCRPDCKYHRCKRHLSCERSESLSLTWKSASALSLTDYLVFPIWKGEDVRPIALSWRWTRENPLRNYHREFLMIPDEDIAWLAGLYVAEGSFFGRHYTSISMHKKEREYLEKAYAIAAKNFRAKLNGVRPLGNGLSYVLCSRPLQLFLAFFGKGAAKKRIPPFVFAWPSELRRSFLKGYFLGDGTVSAAEVKATTVSLSLALGLFTLASLEGVRPNLHKATMSKGNMVTVGGRTYRITARHQPWTVAFSRLKAASLGLEPANLERRIGEARLGDFILLPVKKLSYEPYNGPVFDVTLEGEDRLQHTFILGSILSSNCYVELGTRKMSPRPYLRPPLETKREEIERIWSG
ncbi:MAG: hypothetical protein DRJ03_19335 [Chloroflexi bacterium]|nr:MAG: hypothetical protein DRJ03_19335 [Chloroflexota bacterium]